MGVKYLWNIIDDARTISTLECLRGKTISVDLSIWIVEAIQTLQFKSSIKKPHLRNMFFRILFLRRLGVKLVFITEGEPPSLKQDTMKKRAMNKYGTKVKVKGKIGRSRFQHTINECTKMLDLIGVPHIRAHGEAEAMCATLNKHGLTDGCLTNDGDFFLYGGNTIYRDFGINPKDQNVLVYTAENIKRDVRINRNDMIGLALLNGCDYTEGLMGVGIKTVKKFLEERDFSEDLLVRFQQWKECGYNECEFTQSEALIIKKAKKFDTFWNEKVIDEFLIQQDRLDGVQKKIKFGYPNIKSLQKYLLDQLEWPEEYTLPKILQLATSTYLEKLHDAVPFPVPIHPVRILKTRCRMGVSLVDVAWEECVDDNITYGEKWEDCPDAFVTTENQQVVTKMLPSLLEDYEASKDKQKKGSRKNKKEEITDTKNSESSIAASAQATELCAGKTSCNTGNMKEDIFNMPDSSSGDCISEISQEPTRGSLLNLFSKSDKETCDASEVKSNKVADEMEETDGLLMPSLSERLSKLRLTKCEGSLKPVIWDQQLPFANSEDAKKRQQNVAIEKKFSHIASPITMGDVDLPKEEENPSFNNREESFQTDYFSAVKKPLQSTPSISCKTSVEKVWNDSIMGNFSESLTDSILADFTGSCEEMLDRVSVENSVCLSFKHHETASKQSHQIITPCKADGSVIVSNQSNDFFTPGSDEIFLAALDCDSQGIDDKENCCNHHTSISCMAADNSVSPLSNTSHRSGCFDATTPICHDIITPNIFVVENNHTSLNYAAKTGETPLRDITNSTPCGMKIKSVCQQINEDECDKKLGGHSDEQSKNVNNLTQDYETELRRRLDLSNENIDSIFKDSNTIDEPATLLVEDSPLFSLADRLKTRLRHR